MRAWPLALACLPAGFAVADLSGSRPAGGVVLLAAGLATVAVSHAPRSKRLAWGGIAFAGFVVSHLLADPLGAWGAVAAVAVVAGAAGWALLDEQRAPLPA